MAVTKNPVKWAEASREFFGDVQAEMRKVAWPTQEETIRATVGVLIIVGVIGVLLAFFDLGLAEVMRRLLPS